MKKIDAKQLTTYVTLIGAIVLIAVYFLVYKAYNDKTAVLENSNAVLNQHIGDLKEYYDKMGEYKNQITDMKNQVRDWLGEFPADVKEEDVLVLAIETEKNAMVGYKSINIGNREALKTIPVETVTGAQMEDLTQEIFYVQRKTTYGNVTDYQNLKTLVDQINASENRLNISNFTYSKNDESGLMEGTIEVCFYAVLGTGKEYVPQNLPDYESGLPNLFGSWIIPEDEAGEEVVQE